MKEETLLDSDENLSVEVERERTVKTKNSMTGNIKLDMHTFYSRVSFPSWLELQVCGQGKTDQVRKKIWKLF